MYYSVLSQLDSLADLYIFVASLVIGLLALLRWKSGPLRFWFAANCFLAGIWSLSNFTSSIGFLSLFLFFLRLGSIGWIFLGPTLFIFLAYFLGREDLVQARRRRLLLLALAFPFWAAFVVSPGFFSSILRSPEDGDYLMAPNSFFSFILVSVIGWAVAQVWILVRSLRRQFDPLIRRRSRVLLLLLAGMSALGITTDVILPALNFYLSSFGGILDGLFCMTAFAMIQRFQLLPSAQVLSAKVDRLQEFNRALEEKVEERTRELRESGQRYREIFENVQEFILALDLEGRITSANPQVKHTIGFKTDHLVGKKLAELIEEYLSPQLLENWKKVWLEIQAKVQKPGDLFREEVIMPIASGEWRAFLFTYSGIFREGRLVGYLHIGRDVTESKKAEKALRESEVRYREIFDNVQEMIRSLDLEGRILSGNPRVHTLVGGDPEQDQGRLLSEVIADSKPPAILEKWQKAWQQIRQGIQKPGDVFQEEVILPFVSGEFKTLAFTYSGIFRQGRLAGYLQMGRDITESVRLKQALEEYSANLEQLVAARTRELEATYKKLAESARQAGKAEMAAGVLHNLGNAINSIGVRLEMIRAHICNCPMESVLRAVEFLEQQQEHLGSFFREDPKGKQVLPFLKELAVASQPVRAQVKETLEFVRGKIQHIAEIITVEQRYHRPGQLTEPADLNQVVRESFSLLQDSLQRRGIQVEQELAELPLVNLDRSQAIQVVFNLLKNAAEALEKNPEGERRIRVQTRIAPDAAGELEITVADNGSGIRPEDLSRLFQFGFTTKALRGGHGFGLHASANYIQSVGGRIEAASQGPGQGAVFRVYFPLGADQEKVTSDLEKEEDHEPAHIGD